jgi:hypothetical protein
MFFIIGGFLLVLWLIGFIGFHLLGAYIHLVLVLAFASMVMGLFTRRATT